MAAPSPSRKAPARRAAALALLLVLPALAAGCDAVGGSGERPNVVVFLIDTLRADWLRSYGRGEPTSPAMDALARHGVLFEQASAPAPWTLPSVASIFTSRFVVGHDVAYDGQKLAQGVPTLAERLAERGYETASFYTNPYAGPMSGLDRGFARVESASPAVRGERVRRWLEERAEEPFFLYVHNKEPHDPFAASPRYVRPFGRVPRAVRRRVMQAFGRFRALTRVDFVKGRPVGSTDNAPQQRLMMRRLEELQPRIETLYSGAVRESDARVAEVIRALRSTGHWEDTLFVLLSDHGEEMGEHGGWQHDQSVYEELIRVPLVIRLPGDRAAGRRVERPVSLVDLMPTLLEAADAGPPPEHARGRSLLPLLDGDAPAEATEEPEPRVVAVRHNRKKYFRPFEEIRGDLNVAVREGRWKGILNVEPDRFELYDLAADPGETNDRSAEEPRRSERLRAHAEARLERFLEETVPSEGGGLPSVDAQTRKRLEALGYLGGEPSEETEAPEPAPAP